MARVQRPPLALTSIRCLILPNHHARRFHGVGDHIGPEAHSLDVTTLSTGPIARPLTFRDLNVEVPAYAFKTGTPNGGAKVDGVNQA